MVDARYEGVTLEDHVFCGPSMVFTHVFNLEELADKCTEGQLSADERIEYETYVQALKFIAVLQAQARSLLANGQG